MLSPVHAAPGERSVSVVSGGVIRLGLPAQGAPLERRAGRLHTKFINCKEPRCTMQIFYGMNQFSEGCPDGSSAGEFPTSGGARESL